MLQKTSIYLRSFFFLLPCVGMASDPSDPLIENIQRRPGTQPIVIPTQPITTPSQEPSRLSNFFSYPRPRREYYSGSAPRKLEDAIKTGDTLSIAYFAASPDTSCFALHEFMGAPAAQGSPIQRILKSECSKKINEGMSFPS